jgi:hypothetical protein
VILSRGLSIVKMILLTVGLVRRNICRRSLEPDNIYVFAMIYNTNIGRSEVL